MLTIALVWYAIGLAGSALTLWFAFHKDGLDLTLRDIVVIGGLLALTGPINLLTGMLLAAGYAINKIPHLDHVVLRGRR